MKFSSFVAACSLVVGSVSATPFNLEKNQVKAPYFVLTGDSTTATKNGWGDGFLKFLQNGAAGLNLGKNGRTTKSFRSEGWWSDAIDAVNSKKGSYQPIVTIQFGHNDQKPENGVPLADFEKNLGTMVDEVKAAGGTPILITSLTRRGFKNGAVNENLVNERAIAIKVAQAKGVVSLDLNKASVDYINAIGETNAHYYDFESGDSTHLNTAGATVFGRMVADLLLRERTDLASFIRENKALSDKIWAGQFATGNE